jgi:nitroreductase
MTTTSSTRLDAQAILGSLRWRYATKNFDTARKVSDADVDVVLEAIRLAPTSMGLQPFHVTVVTDGAVKAAMSEVAYGQGQVTSASHVLVFSAKMKLAERAEKLWAAAREGGAPKDSIATMRKYYMITSLRTALPFSRESWTARQAYIALGFGIMAAAQLGIDSCPMEGFSQRKLAKVLRLPSDLRPVALLAIGHRAPTDTIRPKYRLPMQELVSRSL